MEYRLLFAYNCVHPEEGGDFGNPTTTEGSGLTGEFYALVNEDAGTISNE